MKKLEKLLEMKIVWREVIPGGVEFIAEVNGEKCHLKMNDFPDQPLYTLTYKGRQVSFDDAPKIWQFPEID